MKFKNKYNSLEQWRKETKKKTDAKNVEGLGKSRKSAKGV